VSHVIATTLKTKRSSTRTFNKTDAGVASPKKSHSPFEQGTRDLLAAGVVSYAPPGARAAALRAALGTIRSNARCASAAARGSDSRGVPLQLGSTNG